MSDVEQCLYGCGCLFLIIFLILFWWIIPLALVLFGVILLFDRIDMKKNEPMGLGMEIFQSIEARDRQKRCKTCDSVVQQTMTHCPFCGERL